MKKILSFLSVAALFGSCQEKETLLFDGAEWIGTDNVVMYAPYLQEFSLSFDVTLNNPESEAAFLFGGNDERLLSRKQKNRRRNPKYSPTAVKNSPNSIPIAPFESMRGQVRSELFSFVSS